MMPDLLARRRFSVDEYHRMGEVGILPEEERLELIDGEIVTTTPIGPRRAGTVNRLNRLFTSRLGDRVVVQNQNPIELRDVNSELQPDVALLRPRADFYTKSHPDAANVLLLLLLLLLIEVADTTVDIEPRSPPSSASPCWIRDTGLRSRSA